MRREGKGNRLWKSGVERGREMLGLDSSQVGIIWRILGSKDHDVENIFSFSLDFISKVEIASGRRENGLFEGIAIVPRGTILSWLWSWIAGEWREADECSTRNNFWRRARSARESCCPGNVPRGTISGGAGARNVGEPRVRPIIPGGGGFACNCSTWNNFRASTDSQPSRSSPQDVQLGFPRAFHSSSRLLALPNHHLPSRPGELHSFSSRILLQVQLALAASNSAVLSC